MKLRSLTSILPHALVATLAWVLVAMLAVPTVEAADRLNWLGLLERLVNVPSGTEYTQGHEEIRGILTSEFQALGFVASRSEAIEGHRVLSFEMPNSRPRFMLLGHIDTVFKKAEEDQQFEVRGERLYGPGVIDMKGGIVLILDLMKSLSPDQRAAFRIVFNDDEEIGSPYSRDHLKRLARGLHSILVFEPGLPDGAVVSSQSGVRWLKLAVKGKSAHAGLEHHLGYNACIELSHKLVEISKLTDYAKGLTVNAGVISGGAKPNVVCDSAEATIDLRYVQSDDLENALREIGRVRDTQYSHNTRIPFRPEATLDIVAAVPHLPRETTQYLVELAKAAGATIGQNVIASHVGYSSDGNLLAPTGAHILVGLGPHGGGMHTTEEFLAVESYNERYELNRQILILLLNEGGDS